MKQKIIKNHLVILLIFASFTYTFVLKTIYNMICDNLITVSEQTIDFWSDDLSSLMDFGSAYILQLCTNEQIQDSLRSHANADTAAAPTLSAEDAFIKDDFLRDFMSTNSVTLSNIPFMIEITYRRKDGFYVPMYYSSRQNQTGNDIYDKEDSWIKALEARNGKFLWDYYDDSSNSYLRLSKIIFDTEDYSRIIGTISLDFSYEHLALNVLRKLNSQVGVNGAIVNLDTEECIGFRSIPLPEGFSAENANTDFMLPDQTNYFFSRRLSNTDFALAGIKSLSEARRIYHNSCLTLFAAAMAAFILSIVLASILGRSISLPLSRLSLTMKQVKDGNLDISVSTKEKNEIGELYSSFNYMIRMINQLIQENYVTRLNQKQSELDALQSQINTHFLYNTLDSINWLAMDYHAADISYLVTNLSALLRISLNNGNPELTIAQELNHGRSYLNIQTVRFSDRFQIREEIDDSVNNDIVIKMLFQPLIENAILHSFNLPDSVPEENILILRTKNLGDELLLEVCNNADPEELDRIYDIFQNEPDKPSAAYGITSIKRRLDIAYGGKARYFYTIDSSGLLTASIQIPRCFTAPDRSIIPSHNIDSVPI